MHIVVVGAGQVGQAVARSLCGDHEIVVIDRDPDELDGLRREADVMTLEGDGADLDLLERAGTEDADIVIASTDDDRTNILVCATAEALDESIFSIARVAETRFLRTWEQTKRAFGVDLMIGSDRLTASSVVDIGMHPAARVVEQFHGGEVEMIEFEVPEDSRLADRLVRAIDVHDGLRYAAVFTDEGMEVVAGDTRIPGGSRLLVIGRPSEAADLGRQLAPDQTDLERIFVLGGNEIAFQTAEELVKKGRRPKLVDRDPERAEQNAADLPKCIVLNDDPTDPEFLRSEGVHRSDLVVAAMRPDEDNLLASLQAYDIGAERIVSVVKETENRSVFENSGVQATVNPRNKVIERILKYTVGRPVEKLTFVEHHNGQVFQVELDTDSPVVGRPLQDVAPDFPARMVIGAVTRGGETIIPEGETVLESGDHVVVYANSDVVDEVVNFL